MPPMASGTVQWFPAEIRKLILAIKKHEVIYNQRHEDFGLRHLHNKAWKAVAEAVGGEKTDTQCRDKWNCLRGTYRRHVRTELTNNVKRRSGWPWANMMSFIKRHVIDKDELESYVERVKVRNTSISAALKNAKDQQCTNNIPIKPKSPITPAQTVGSMTPHQVNCPANVNNLATVSISGASTVKAGGNLAFSNAIYSGGLILNRVGIGIVQPNQAIGIVQPNQQNVTMGIVQPNQTGGMGIKIIQPSQTMSVMQPSQVISGVNERQSNQTKETNPSEKTQADTSSKNTFYVDLSKVKPDPDQAKSPDRTEFVDMQAVVKNEPMDDDNDDDLEFSGEFSFLPEDSASQDSCLAGVVDQLKNKECGEESSEQQRENEQPQSQEKNEQLRTTERRKEKEKEDEELNASNQLFMKSTVEHMRHLSPYDQSVFKLKVQQLLHDMMFPAAARQTN